jgi:hypothetical protein
MWEILNVIGQFFFKAWMYTSSGFFIEIFFSAVFGYFDSKNTTIELDNKLIDAKKLMGHITLWMIPVYSIFLLAFEYLSIWLVFDMSIPFYFRYLIYAVMFTSVEAGTGALYDKILGFCPWDYSYDKYKIFPKGYAKWTYIPFWGIAGLALEPYARMVHSLANFI